MILVRFNPNGEAVFIYEDGHPLLRLGSPQTIRASHVEPTQDSKWQADMGPLKGPKLPPTKTRSLALELEVEWLKKEILHL